MLPVFTEFSSAGLYEETNIVTIRWALNKHAGTEAFSLCQGTRL